VKGRKRHLVVDTLGLVLMAVVHSAGLQDDQKMAFGQVLVRLWERGWSRLSRLWADGMYQGSAGLWAMLFGWVLTVVRRAEGQPPFSPVPRRWWWSAPSPGSAGTGGSARTTRRSPSTARR
jgi:putative transposase